ncbi:hypothetical protein [Ralstonia pseudosolanacearum]|uniref:hypothetical protein n=1 Tax=Ralstonia pseudosolanacearum TaxID=1310165 RepID=UPI003CEA2548
MNATRRALTKQQAETVAQTLVDCCGAQLNKGDRTFFVQIMSSRAAFAEWHFSAAGGFTATLRFPEMSVVNTTDHPTEKWVDMLMRANSALCFTVPAGIDMPVDADPFPTFRRAGFQAPAFA